MILDEIQHLGGGLIYKKIDLDMIPQHLLEKTNKIVENSFFVDIRNVNSLETVKFDEKG